MDILMVYWNSVWANSRRDRSSLLADHSSAELQAYERRLRASKRRPGGAEIVSLADRARLTDRPGAATRAD